LRSILNNLCLGFYQNVFFENDCDLDSDEGNEPIVPSRLVIPYQFFLQFINESLATANKPTCSSQSNKYLFPNFVEKIRNLYLPYCLLWSSILLGSYTFDVFIMIYPLFSCRPKSISPSCKWDWETWAFTNVPGVFSKLRINHHQPTSLKYNSK